MGSDMCRAHLRKLLALLAAFEKEPKTIEGRRIYSWFTSGEDIFKELFNLGLHTNWSYSTLNKYTETSEVISIFSTKGNQQWLQTFISLYPSLRIDLDLVGSAGDVCSVRSGIEVLLKGLKNIDKSFDKVLDDLEEFGELDELDRCLRIWNNTGHRPDFSHSDTKPSTVPETHWWWH